MKNSFFLSVLIVLPCFLFSCAKQVARNPEPAIVPSVKQSAKHPDYAKKSKKDTLTYIVAFHDTLERAHFGNALEKLIKSFSSSAADDSTKALYIKAQAVTSAPAPASPRSSPVLPTASPVPQKQEIVSGRPEQISRFGGLAVIYTSRGSLPPSLSPLVEALNCRVASGLCKTKDSVSAICDISQVSEKKVAITFSSMAQNAVGKQFSAFDIVALWSSFVKQHPAEGRALFRYVNGVDQFISGREAVVPGFQVSDAKTVTLQLSQPDPMAACRLCSPRLFPISFKTGPYYVKNEKSGLLQLAPNEYFRSGKPFLNSCEIRLGKDSNPFLAFSMNRYDIVELYSLKDIDYARRLFSGKAILRVNAEDRYFLSLALQNPDLRAALCRLFDGKDILSNYVKAEGDVVSSVETREEPPSTPPPSAPALTSMPSALGIAPIVVLFHNDDPVAGVIADKLLADISHTGLSCTVKGVSIEEYEKSLIKRDYGIAVGSVLGSVMQDQSERLRVAAMWFNDETNERKRIDDNLEYPLFSIKTYLLYKNKIGFFNDAIEGVFVKE